MRQNITILVAVFAPASSWAAPLCGAAEWPASQRVFVERYCSDCHDAAAKEGGLDLAAFSHDLTDAETLRRWVRVLRPHRRGEMPPKEARRSPSRRRQAGVSRVARPVAGRRRPRAARSGLSPAEPRRIREHDPRSVSACGPKWPRCCPRTPRRTASTTSARRSRLPRNWSRPISAPPTWRSTWCSRRNSSRRGSSSIDVHRRLQDPRQCQAGLSLPGRRRRALPVGPEEHARPQFRRAGGGHVSRSLPGPGLSQHAADQGRSRRPATSTRATAAGTPSAISTCSRS